MSQLQSITQSTERKFKVLLVDDNDAFRDMITAQLEVFGCSVKSAGTASGFLATLIEANDRFDFAVIDYRLPDLNGDHIVTWLEQSEQETVHSLPILVVTGHPDALPDVLLETDRNVAVLAKPYRIHDLAKSVTDLMARGLRH